MRKEIILLAAGVFVCLGMVVEAGTYSGGTGDAETPYLIADANDIIEMRNTSDDWSSHFLMTADVNMIDYTFTTAVIAPDTSLDWGFQGTPFTGNFDGADYKIVNLTIDTAGESNDYLGLFGYIEIGGQVENLSIENVTITGSGGSSCIGSLCGSNGYYYSSLLGGTIINCSVIGSISGADYLGGLCGHNNKGTISNCHAATSITGGDRLGGLCGWNESGSLSYCSATGIVNGTGYSLGGLCGENDKGIIYSSFANGSIIGGDDSGEAGGLCGNNNQGIINNCYSTATVSCHWISAGLCGYNEYGTITKCFAVSLVAGDGFVGGLCGLNRGMVYHSFWDTQVSGIISSAGGIGLTTIEMMDIDTYAGWGDDTWTIDNGNDYPHLAWENKPGSPIINPPRTYSGGSGTTEEPYLISNDDDLITLATYSSDWDKCFKLIDDIDMSAFSFTSFFIPEFSGVLDGNDHVISNLTIDTLSDVNIGNDNIWYLGFFAKINGEQAQVKNLGLENITVTGGYGDYVAGLCAYNNGGTISNCYVSGSVNGTGSSWNLGGLCGYNDGGIIDNCYAEGYVNGGGHNIGGLCGYNKFGTISSSYATNEVIGRFEVGGLCGYNSWGTISKCKATGSVSGSNSGGLCGINSYGTITNSYTTSTLLEYSRGGLCSLNSNGNIVNCYATGAVSGDESFGGLCRSNWGIVYNSFWDTETSGTTSSDGGIGLTTTEMMDINTYSGWGDDIWNIDNGNDYPRLVWEGKTGVPIIDPPRTYSGGSGTAEEPYLMNEPNDLITLGMYPSDWDKHYKQTDDIDMSDIIFSSFVIPVFGGVFDGDGYTISNLAIDTYSDDDSANDNQDYLGLFGRIGDEQAQMKKLNLENVSVTGGYSSGYKGGLCGDNRGTIDSCYISGSITWGEGIGGMSGENWGTIRNSHTNIIISGNTGLGGLCGNNWGIISSCHASGSVAGFEGLGGLCGGNEGTISDCYATSLVEAATISSDFSYYGGLCGINHYNSIIINCYASGNVTGGRRAGGLCGLNGSTIISCDATGAVSGIYELGGLCGLNETGQISNCCATGDVSGKDYLGGLCGSNDVGRISNSCAMGSVTSGDYAEYLGGLCGYHSSATISNCYATGPVTGGNHSYSLGGLCGANNNGRMRNCYAVGLVSTGFNSYYLGGLCGDYGGTYAEITNSFWDVDATGMIYGVGGYGSGIVNLLGKTTEEMQTQSTFTDYGWDFVDEDVNGTNDIWRMCEDGIDYPHLFYQYNVNGDFACPDGVGTDDLLSLSSNWLNSEELDTGFSYPCDPTFDGVTNLADYVALAENWLSGN